MRKHIAVFLAMVALIGGSGFAGAASASRTALAAADTSAVSRDSMMNAVLASIRGRGQQPAESVFKNIQILKGRPAGQIARIMNFGFGRSLGVGCAHCHDVNDFASDSIEAKRIARQMFTMVATINGELLTKIEGIQGTPAPVINCTTCHRGEIKPALDLPPPR